MKAVQIYDVTKEDYIQIGSGLVSHNSASVPFTQEPTFIAINRCIREGDKVVGGIIAEVYCWKVLYIDILWVEEEYRGRGYASALMADVENRAKELGCKLSHLDTFDFQAKPFYEKLGYTTFGTLENCPEGHNRYYMSKKLID